MRLRPWLARSFHGQGLGLGLGLGHRVVLPLASEELPRVFVDTDAVDVEVGQVGVERAVLAHLPQQG